MALAIYRDRPLLHRLEQGCLRLGGRSIDFVREHEIGKDGARHLGNRFATTGLSLG